MASSIHDLLHPVRMRIIQALMPSERLTVQEIESRLDDVPPATLYRHVKKLQEIGLIKVVDEQQIRGTIKKTYAISIGALRTPDDFVDISNEEHLNYFLLFTSFLQSEYKRYLESSDKQFEQDGVGYRYVSVYASDEEFHDWLLDFRKLMERLMENKNSKGRKKRTIANIFLPTKE
ncbi:helix-turn-helix domain-containing protein [Aquibacillus kalidii]|uniref:helix-turn-helix domain-containing protein n=1 Tax=Aquibacillus kalidii TaxID=2762597 RepID=UPI00164976C4|nr:helix-turn-helix domain-containing protein [Aquibacillus kalidii]